MSWDARQRGLLSAMGYRVLRQAGAVVAPPEAVVVAETPSAAAVATDDPLLRALRRAAGGRDPSSLPLPPLDRLRGDAAAKRALWPLLRALRRH